MASRMSIIQDDEACNASNWSASINLRVCFNNDPHSSILFFPYFLGITIRLQ